jgi:uncharacterized YigZ family protein
MTEKAEDIYLSIAQTSVGVYKEKGSKFLAFAFPVSSEEQIKSCLEKLRKEYFDARHHCYAYALGKDQKVFRANDDGEPNHSAGDPILGQIRSHQLSDILIVVVRYFGGVKLGVGGLITAYKTAAAEAITNAQIIEKIVTQTWQLHFKYEAMNEVMKLVKDLDLQVITQQFDLECSLTLEIRQSLLFSFEEKIGKIDGVEIEQL